MEIKCPSCRKLNRFDESEAGNRQCRRCGGDLARLYLVARAAEHKINESKRFLLEKKPDTAMTLAEESWQLKHSTEAAKLAFLASVAKKNYTPAFSWYLRSCKSKS
ncbi:MAG: hypothetical protein ACUZ8H_02260 [Candidatus Anammoxibacter sp.]